MNEDSFAGHENVPNGSGESSGFDALQGSDRDAGLEAATPSAGSSFGAGLDDSGPASGAPKRKTTRRRTSRKKTPASSEGRSTQKTKTADTDSEESGEAASAPKRRRRGSRGGRGKSASSKAAEPELDFEAPVEEASAPTEGAADEAPAKPKARRSRRSRRRSKSEPSDEPEVVETSEAPAEEPEREARRDKKDEGPAEDKPKRRRGTRGGRGRRKTSTATRAVEVEAIPGELDELPELRDLPEDAELVSSSSGSREGDADESERPARSKRRRKKASKSAASAEDALAPRSRMPEVARDQVILVNAHSPNETRVAVVHDSKIVDLQMNVHQHRSLVNDIYRGRVVNLESAIGAAFVDFGQGRNGFLHASDVLEAYGEKDWQLDKLLTARVADDEINDGLQAELAPDDDEEEEAESGKASAASKKKGARRSKRSSKKSTSNKQGGGHRRARPRLPIGDLLQKGQLVVAQITKDAIGDKGPTLTTYISIPGRYLVLMPSLARTGVSRKIEDDRERRRLKRILSGLDIPDGMGVIVRTAGIGKTKIELRRDLESLLASWNTFSKRLVLGRNPMPLYQESDVAIRTMRDLFSTRTSKVIVDDEAVYERMVDFTRVLMPEHLDRVELHDGPRPLFHTHGVEPDFERIFSRRVELPSGGSIVIDQTEALVAIDVNSGRTRDEGAGFEDIALKTNLEAAQEIARQMRLRDLGGIIVLDFIDMMRSGNRRLVERAVRDHLADDRARSKIGRISQFGLLEMTRQRLGPGLSKLLYDACLRCRGTGRQRTAESRGQALLRRLGSALTLKGFTSVEICAHPETIEYLQQRCAPELKRLKDAHKRELRFKADPEQLEDSVLHYLRADGREVRPGGRRKR